MSYISFPFLCVLFAAIYLSVTRDFNGCIRNGEPIVRVLVKSFLHISPTTLPVFISFSSFELPLSALYSLPTIKNFTNPHHLKARLIFIFPKMICLICLPQLWSVSIGTQMYFAVCPELEMAWKLYLYPFKSIVTYVGVKDSVLIVFWKLHIYINIFFIMENFKLTKIQWLSVHIFYLLVFFFIFRRSLGISVSLSDVSCKYSSQSIFILLLKYYYIISLKYYIIIEI